VNTCEHTKTTIDGGRNGGRNHSLAKRMEEPPSHQLDGTLEVTSAGEGP
jgi:hypothetical protein